jgi:hypothetical protein
MANEILNKIKIALGMEVPAEKQTFTEVATLEDGTTVTADSFEVGKVLYVVDADGASSIATPDKQYVINGMNVTVDENGVITEATDVAVSAAEVEVEIPETEAPEAETPATPSEPAAEIAMLTENVSQIMEAMTVLIERVKKLEEEHASTTQNMSTLEEKFSNIPGAARIVAQNTSKMTAEELLTKRFVDAAASLNNK